MAKEKGKNPFKFQGFSERIANIRLDISHRVEKRASEPEETETFCNEALNKWRELNCTVQFQEFCKEISPLIQTLAQLVHHEQSVIAILQKYLLQQDNSLAMEPLLDVVVQISRDLQSDFYPHFKDFFNVFVTLLKRYALDSEILELIFTALGYLFKFLWRYMVKDIENVFKLYSSLLSMHQKPYIQQFAAESFAFLMRKVKDHSKLLDFLYGFLATHEDMVEGMGFLCFEMMKGVKKQFHSQTEKIFPLMLSKLGPVQNENSINLHTALPWQLVFECQLHTIKLMAKYTSSEGSYVVEKSLTRQLMKLYNISENIYGEEEWKALSFQLSYVLRLTDFWLSYKGGTYVSDHLIIFDVVSALLKAPQVSQHIPTPLLNLTSSILLADLSGLHKDIHQKQLIKNVFQSDRHPPIEYPLDRVLDFTRSLLKWSSFTSNVLPLLLTYCQSKLFNGVSNEDKASIILILTQIVLSGVVNKDYGVDITSRKGLIYFPKSATKNGGKILDCLLECLEVVDNSSNLGLVWGALVCVPCIRPLPGPKCAKKILDFLTRSLEHLQSGKDIQNTQHWLFVISQAVMSYLIMNPQPKNKDEQLGMDFVLEILSKYPDNVHLLHSIAAILSNAKSTNQKDLLSTDNLRRVYPLIKTNLSNPAHLVRQKTLEILKEFEQMKLIATEEESQPGKCNLFQICLEAESTLPTFQHYRDKEILLRKLTYSTSHHKSLPEFYHDVTPRFLIGQLYINFSPTWQPVIEILKSHAHGQDVKTFWAVLHEYLELAATNAEKELDSEETRTSDIIRYEEGQTDSLDELFTSLFNVATGPREDNRTDHINFRHLLWKTMAEFPGIVELKSRDLVPLLLRFMSNEYERCDENTIPSQDIRKKERQDNHVVTVSMATDHDESVATDQEKPEHTHTKRRKGATKSLCVHLTLFSLFHNPKALSKEPQVRRIYMTMLCHRDSEVQKIAVKCLMSYKFSYVMPYKDNLERLLEDESFRDELALLTEDEGKAVVDAAHREGLMPIVIRLLYGKMQRWTGAGSSGKSGIGVRRATVLRFLGNCSLEELTVFMDLILAPFKHLCIDPDVIPTPRDLSSVVPIRKQLGILNMMQHLLLNLGGAFDTFLPSLLQICLSLLSTCVFALEKREELHPPHISQLKQVRQLAICRLIEFFETKPDYNYSRVIDAIYEAAVWPQLDNLEQESIQSPTPMLRLLFTWTKRFRYIPLLSRKPLNRPDTSIMGHVFNCLNACNVSHSVVTMVMEMADNLLSVSEDDGTGQDMMELGTELSSTSSQESNIPYGTRILLPHLSVIIQHLVQTVKVLTKSSKQGPRKSKPGLPKLELSVLSKISPFVSDQENSAALIKLLLPFIYLRQREETETDTLSTIKNLLSNVETPASFAKPLGRLFAQLNSRTSRQRLCDVFEEIARLDPSYETVSVIVTQMNSWDRKKIEEPDYGKRMTGFASAVDLISRGEIEDLIEDTGSPPTPPINDSPPIDFILVILHNCLYFVHRSDDMAIRDGAIGCINSIIQRVAGCNESEEFNELIVNCVLPSCKLAFRSKNEAARNEFVGILATMVRQFDHVIFEDMRILVDKDPEADFFENIRHIQLHRRIRALRRIESLCQKSTFKPSTLLAFLLPLATVYLFEYSGNKDHNLVTQAISTVGAISACLPWSKYSNLLRLYLRMLRREKERQKVVVRVVVAVLDGFHFDLSSYNLTVESLQTQETPRQTELQQSKETTEGIDIEEKQTDEKGDDHDDDDDDDDELEDDGSNVRAKNEYITEALAKKIYDTITKKILPQLNKSLTKKVESYHKLSHTKSNDQQEALRVPIALAMVKLLKSLPQHTLHLHLPGLLLRVCITLKSRARDVRDTARDVLCQIALSLGTKYFSFIIKEMKSTLTRGYQLHVLGFTLHSLLDRMLPTLSPGDLDHCIPSITEILVDDLFGEVATEREVEKLANKLHEAKSSKSYESFEILAKVIGSTSISLLVSPLQEVLDSNQSHKVSQRVEEALRKIGVGLQANTQLSTQTLMVFIHRIINEKLTAIATKKIEKDKAANSDKSDSQAEMSRKTADCYLLSPSPVRGGKAPGLSTKTNAHIIVEFGLQMLNTALKRGKISGTDQSHLQMLDPFVPVLSNCMQTKHVKVLTLSLRCVCVVIKLPLPSLARKVPNMAKLLFKCLKNYATAGAKIGENYEMVLSAFKAMTVIIRDFNKYTIAEKHLQVLLGFVEEDIHDHTRQGTAFPLLRAILTRKLIVPEIHDVMKKVSQLSITGATPTVQQQCRQCVMQYMLDYPLGKKLQRLLEFYVSQLSYEHETGRESALDMVTSIFNGFPESFLFKYASFFFVPLTTRLVNDDSAACRKSTATAIKTLLIKLDLERRDILFRMVVEWFTNDKVILRRLAAQVCGQFVEVESKAFDRRLPTTLPLISEMIKPEHYHMEEQEEELRNDISSSDRGLDHLLFNALTTLAKILQESRLVWEVKTKKDMDSIWVSVETHLLHPHAWIRLVSCRLFGLLFAAWKPEDLNEKAIPEIPDYLAVSTRDKIVHLGNTFCHQLESPFLEKELGDQIIKNLVFISKFLYLYDNGNHFQNDSAKSSSEENGDDFTLKSLFNKLERLAKHEASQTPKKTQKRSCVMRWTAAVATVLGKDSVIPYLRDILQPLHRELDISTTYKDPELQNTTQEVLDLVKSIVGREAVSRVYSELQRDVTDVKEKNRKKRALEAVADPAMNARRKMKRNLSKRETRKRKIDKFKPERKLKKTRQAIEPDD